MVFFANHRLVERNISRVSHEEASFDELPQAQRRFVALRTQFAA